MSELREYRSPNGALFVSSDGPDSVIGDQVEEAMVESGREALGIAVALLGHRDVLKGEQLLEVVQQLVLSLTEVLSVADARGVRLDSQ